jgi:hypothetical protein
MRTPTQLETIQALLERSKRPEPFLPIRRSFVQVKPRGGGGPAPLAAFVRNRRVKALDLYLLAHAVASGKPYDVRLPAAVWARALGPVPPLSSQKFISRTWTWLEGQKLIETERVGRMRRVVILSEDASRKPYRHPGEKGLEDRGHYFKLPYAYWHGNFHNRLGLPAKAVLLIALSLQDDFLLPIERGQDWYGLSRDTVRKGLRDLRALGLLDVREFYKPAPLSTLGYTRERRYTLREPFRPHASTSARRRPRKAQPKEKRQGRRPAKDRTAPAPPRR